MVFVSSYHRHAIAAALSSAGFPAACTYGKLSQAGRANTLLGLKTGQYRVLVCSDLMARGIDADMVELVVNLELPIDKETYLHRMGRCGRFGTNGVYVSIVLPDEESGVDYYAHQLGAEIPAFDGGVTAAAHEETEKYLSWG